MILVTGANGFVGSYLLKLLVQQSEPIRAIYRKSSNMELVNSIRDKIEWVEGDLLDISSVRQAMHGIDKVYHSGVKISFQKNELDHMMKVNVEGTANVVNAALESGIKKLLHVSSIAAIGRNQQKQNLSEKTQWENSGWNSQYAISKHSAEREVWRGIAEGLTAVIVNPSVILGAGNWTNGTGLIFKKIYEGLRFYPAGISGFVDVRDVTRIMVKLMESDIHSERFIINAVNLDYKDLFAQIANHMGKNSPKIAFTRWMSRIAYRLEGAVSYPIGRKPLLTKELVHNTGGQFHYDNAKLIEKIGWQYIPMEQTIADTSAIIQQTYKAGYGVFPI